jgi:hypothetical protein
MGVINIHCGSFSGEHKSGSAFQDVFAEMALTTSPQERAVIERLIAELDTALDHLLIAPEDALTLTPLLRNYNASLESQLAVAGEIDGQISRDAEQAGLEAGTRLQYGEGLGWRAYCARDLIAGFEVSNAEAEPVALVW